MSGEIVSLQFGHYSNHIGAHLWNGIENSFVYTPNETSEVNHDILYRIGSSGKGQETYTARLLLTDLKRSLGSVSERGDWYEENDEELKQDCTPKWDSDVEVIKEPLVEPNQFMKDVETCGISTKDTRSYELDGMVNTWTDFLYARFHPRTVSIVKQYEHKHPKKKFDTFTNGQALWKTREFDEDFVDNIRKYVEECDHLQGFHVTLDSNDGFSGLGAACIEHIKDEYTGGVLVFPVIDSVLSTEPMDVSIRVANLALCYKSLVENAGLFIPLSVAHATHWRLTNFQKFKHIDYKTDSSYHTSAILASFIDSITLPYRLKSNVGYSLKGLCADLSGLGRKMAAGSLGLPFGLTDKSYLIEYLDKLQDSLFTSLTPNCTISCDKTMQIFTLRGVGEDILKKPLRDAGKQIQMEAYKYDSVKDMMEFYFSCNGYATGSNVTVAHSPYKLPSSFPQFFTDNVNHNGLIDPVPREENENVLRIPLIAGAHNTLTIFDSLGGLIREAERIKIGKLYRFKDTGLEDDEYTETLDFLKEFQERYEENVFL